MPDGPWPATGAILAAIETAGGMPAVVVGKPERIMFDIAREALAGCTRIGVIGDHLTADIQGAKRAGLDAILVLTGATSQADLERAPIPPDLVLDSLAALPRSNRGHVMTGHPARRAELLTPAGAARSTWTTTPPHRWTPVWSRRCCRT